jgi:trimethylamine--corrinoid protein Co-methyltransferase
VIDDDINGQVMRLVRGLDFTEESLSLEVIHEVCTDGPGHYLGHPQTLQLMNTEYHYPHTADRATRQNWEDAGGLDMRERARRKARHILTTSFPTIIPAEVDARLRREFNLLLPREVMAAGGYP